MKRVIFNLSEEQDARLTELADRMGVSKAEALRRAIEIYQFIKDAQEGGDEIRTRGKDGKETTLRIVG
jgi:predicted DNA-binding protein